MRLHQGHIPKLNNIIYHPEVLKMVTDDYHDSNQMDLGEVFLKNPQYYVLSPIKGAAFLLIPNTFAMYEVHTMVIPDARGKEAVQAAKDAATWMFNNSTCEKILTRVPFFNRPAKIFAKMVGMIEEGVCTKSFKKDETLHDQWVLGLEKEKFLCQQ